MELRTDFETRTNKFLYKINEEFFRPQGLYCLVMTWNPNTNQRIQQLDITSSSSDAGPGLGLSSFRSSDVRGIALER
jgi:hypothetical protein